MNPLDTRLVGQRLVALRDYHNLKQGEFADSVGIDRSSYSKIENGTKPLKAEMAYEIAEKWGVSMDFLYRGRLTELPKRLADMLMTNRTKGDL
ncbi:helix-turn-helix transcriptional regulator [Oceanicola sp. D3]|uniref:helix-turn-helix domain-containing protein n=1 Tax=Oceanicola sp. D3 TaxID=2587163 RepID=UPI001121CE8A|nr:helix-turn-helix transcriptional regulator [Oceanicola sp. D3]QDC11258.1 helix-turn-helix transcriptional regulator [Oceanicola sp. D3]